MLRRKFLVLAFLLFSLLPAAVSAQDVNNFRVSSFEADYYLSRNEQKTSELRVVELIRAEFPDYDQNHGILRSIPKTYQDHTVSLKIDSVTDGAGKAWNYSTSTENDNEVLKIGDADKYVRGPQTYRIEYRLKNVISFQDQDEFYWDINGTDWRVPFDKVVGRVHLPAELVSAKSNDQLCFSGSFGSSVSNCDLTSAAEGDGAVLTVASRSSLVRGENISFVIGFTKGTFQLGPEIAAEKNRVRNLIILAVSSFLIPLIASIWFVVRRWRRYGRDPKAKTAVVPEYIPPKDMSVLKSEMILQEKIRPQAITATILDLAVRHYLVIHEIKKERIFKDATEYELEIVKDTSEQPQEYKTVLEKIFAGNVAVGARVNMVTLRNKLYPAVDELNKSVGQELSDQGLFSGSPDKVRKRYLKIGGFMTGIGFFGFFLPFLIPLTLGLMLGGFAVLMSSHFMPARTEQGVAMRQYLEGLKTYMKLAESERLEFSQGLTTAERFAASPTDPAEKIKLFERLLPYSVLFGIDKDWAKEFADLYTQPPSWYSGNSGAFNAAYLGSTLGTFNNTAVSAFSSPSSSGSSGFGGGGSSGGGGGGGGGGGW